MRIRTRAILSICVASVVIQATSATFAFEGGPGSPPRSIAGTWWSGFDQGAFNATITKAIPFAGGFVAIGDFTTIGRLSANRIAIYDGSAWHALGDGLSTTPRVVLEFEGDIVVGEQGRVRRWNGSAWSTVGGDAGTADQVMALGTYSGVLYASYFESGVKRWNGTAWDLVAVVSGTFQPVVQAFAVFDGKLVAAGRFVQIGSTPASAIAAFDGVGWSPLGTGFSSGAVVQELIVTPLGLVASGEFTSVGGQPASGLARWASSTWTGLAGSASSLAMWVDVLVGIRNGEVWQLLHDVWQALPSGTNFPKTALVCVSTSIYAAGRVRDLAQDRQYDFGQLVDLEWRRVTLDGFGLDGPVKAMCVYRDTLIVAGEFENYGSHMLQWDGSRWRRFPQPIPRVSVLRVFEGDLIAAGWFESAGAIVCNSIARWDGSQWHALGTGLVAQVDGASGPGQVRALEEFQGSLVAAGVFGQETGGTGISPPGIARWDGLQWTSLADGPHPGNNPMIPTALAVHGSNLVASNVRLCPELGQIASWNGTSWTNLDIAGAQSVVDDGDELYAALLNVNCEGSSPTLREFARWTGLSWEDIPIPGTRANLLGAVRGQVAYGASLWNGSAWTNLPGGFDDEAHAVVEYGGALYYGGEFTHAGGQGSYYIARWDGDLTPIVVEGFEAAITDEGVQLSWRLASAAVMSLEAVHVERSALRAGPYQELTRTGLLPASSMSFVGQQWASGWYRLRLLFTDGNASFAGPIEAGHTNLESDFELEVPSLLEAGASVSIRYRFGRRQDAIDLGVYDVRGRLVRQLMTGVAVAGSHLQTWDRRGASGDELPRGVYWVRLEAGGRQLARRLVLL